jgi:hypothetical protein
MLAGGQTELKRTAKRKSIRTLCIFRLFPIGQQDQFGAGDIVMPIAVVSIH